MTKHDSLLFKDLTAREREIAERLVEGKSNKEIGDELLISTNTVKQHLLRVFEKAGIHERLAFVVAYYQERVTLLEERLS